MSADIDPTPFDLGPAGEAVGGGFGHGGVPGIGATPLIPGRGGGPTRATPGSRRNLRI